MAEMSTPIILSVYVLALVSLIFAGMPVAFALGLVAVGSIYLSEPTLAAAIGPVTWDGLSNFVLSAIPLFILMGYLLFESKLSTRIYAGIYPLMDRLFPGGLLHTNIVGGAAFAACSGSSIANCATIGTVALPEMEARGYARSIAAGSVAAGGTLGVLIPPSIVLIVYGVMTDQSIGQLFLGGIIPGLVLTLAYMAYIGLRVHLQPALIASGKSIEVCSWNDCFRSLGAVWPAAALFIGVMGSIYTGVATPTEAAAVGCAITLLIAGGTGLLNREVLGRALAGTVKTTGMVMMIYWAAKLMGIYLTFGQVTTNLSNAVMSTGWSPLWILFSIAAFYLILGMLMDGLAAMVITLPLTYPIMMSLGFDPIWYGIFLTMLIEAGLLTPPVGMNLFILKGLRPEYPFGELIRGVMPFFYVLLLVILSLVAFPGLVTFLPRLVYPG